MKLTAVFQKVREGYIGFVEELPGANTQARTLKQARANLGRSRRARPSGEPQSVEEVDREEEGHS